MADPHPDDGVKRVKGGSREARDRLSERPDAARETERTPHGKGALGELPDENNAPRQGKVATEAGVVGSRPATDPAPRKSRFDEGDLHEGDNTITGGGATVRTKDDMKDKT